MTKTEFFQKHGHELFKVDDDNAEYGDYLILHPQEIPLAKELQDRGYTIVSVYEDEHVEFESPFDEADQFHKYGYYAINNSNTNIL
jgi:hypothetical protein